jgi:hypothetical protein
MMVLRLLETVAFLATLGVGVVLSAAWTALLGYWFVRVATMAF